MTDNLPDGYSPPKIEDMTRDELIETIKAMESHHQEHHYMDGFSYKCSDDIAHGLIQWKGTNVCLDFYCECGAHCHYDGDFLYYAQCPHCKTTYQMPYMVYPRIVTEKNIPHVKILEPDEDLE